MRSNSAALTAFLSDETKYKIAPATKHAREEARNT